MKTSKYHTGCVIKKITVFPETVLHFLTENWKLDSMLKHAKLKHKRSSKLQLNLQLLLHCFPKNMKGFRTELWFSFYLMIKCDTDEDSTYDPEALPALRSRDSRVSIAQARSPAPTSCSCPWFGWKPPVQIQRHNRGGDKVWIHSTERNKQKKHKEERITTLFPWVYFDYAMIKMGLEHVSKMINVLKPTYAEKS